MNDIVAVKNPPPALFNELKFPLRPQHMKLYKLICDKSKDNETITQQEIMALYREFARPQTCRTTWENGVGTYEYADRDSWSWENGCRNWTLRALGLLIRYGYISIIPRIELA